MPSEEAPMGPMTRARGKVMEDNVKLFLNELPLDMHASRLLAKAWVLCVCFRNDGLGGMDCEEVEEAQEGKYCKVKTQEAKLLDNLESMPISPYVASKYELHASESTLEL
jgi:hypothetical protein